MKTPLARWLARLILFCALLPAAWAGRTCDTPQPPRQRDIERGLQLADRVRQRLDDSGAQVVLLARAGQDLSRYGLRYSHVGWVYRVHDANAPGGHVWRVLHKLNQCGSSNSAIYRQGLGEFFMDTPWRYEAAWVVPNWDVQTRLMPLLADAQRPASLPPAVQMQHRPYNLVSYAWGVRYQQSNQWAIELLAWSLEPSVRNSPYEATAASRQKAQTWLRERGYQPTVLRIAPLTRLGARVTAANVAFDDHPNAERFSDRIATVTADSMFDWMTRSQISGAVEQVGL